MDKLFISLDKSIKHLRAIHETFKDANNFNISDKNDYDLYKINLEKLNITIDKLKLDSKLYSESGRQMILADLYEYVILGRGYYSLNTKEDRSNFIKFVLFFVNLLMCYESITVSTNTRRKLLKRIAKEVEDIRNEDRFNELIDFQGKIGLPLKETDAPKKLNKYFDSMLPKTAGGLWHELLVYIFLLRNDIGYIIPLLLTQRLIGLNGRIVPPDFLVLTYNKDIYGIEVGIKKEIQSGTFSIQSNIPTATIDTINARTSDRCPICKRWILFCDFLIRNYSDFSFKIESNQINCLNDCTLFSKEEISEGACGYTKYSRKETKTLGYTKHKFADGLHYHYRCVLENLDYGKKVEIIQSQDKHALKTHYPYYQGLEMLIKE